MDTECLWLDVTPLMTSVFRLEKSLKSVTIVELHRSISFKLYKNTE